MGTSAPLLRSVYRSVLRSARRIDENPGLKALLGAADNSSDLCSEARVVLENYMQGRTLYIPDPQSKYSLVDRAREGSVLLRRMGSLDQGLGALRFLNRIIEGGKKQQLLNDQLSPLAAERMPDSRDKVSLAEEPAPGVVLLAHPCLGGWFSRTAVLLVEHNKLGSRGVCLNKPLAATLKDIKEKALRAIRDAGGSLDFVEVEVEGFGVVKLQTQAGAPQHQ
ncbi:unnamed protein product [Ostreobium quekettii]|uniref:Uncharacterized protein n=1 Tax=Ostreobium quekettii TaxID=121088 RepID=A0A8S1IXS2_9CHLO|nr:unnamed protein product [Ostreobium quekettii]